MSVQREIIVDDTILLKELGLDDVEAIFNTIVNERDYLEEWLPFVEFTREISYTRRFVENYLNSDNSDATFAIYYQRKFVGIIGLKDTDPDNKKNRNRLLAIRIVSAQGYNYTLLPGIN